jgi:integrase
MPRPRTGNIRKHASGYSARIRIGPKDRPSFTLGVRSDDAAEERAELLADIAARLRPMAPREEIKVVLEAVGNARTERGLQEAKDAAEALASGEARTAASVAAPTFEDFAKDWTSGKLRKNHPDHVREKDSTEDTRICRMYLNPVIGPTRIPDVTLEDAERVMGRLPSDLAPRTRKKIAQCMRKLLSLAVYPGRHIASNPIPREWMPKIPKSANKAKVCLYPEEDAKLLRCAKVQIERRLSYGILAREGMRASELSSLKWRDVDLDRGRVRLDENKTDDPRAWALSPDVARTLTWWRKRTRGEHGDYVIGLDLRDAAWWLRGDDKDRDKYPGDLRTAGVTRPELFERSSTRQPIRLHDLRATFVTVALANGKTEQWVTDRTGHKSSQMLALYARQARTWAELELGTLRPLDELLPEVRRSRETRSHWAMNGPHPSHPRESNSRPTVYETVALPLS